MKTKICLTCDELVPQGCCTCGPKQILADGYPPRICSYCSARTRDGAPMHARCAERERAYVQGAQDYMSSTGLGWSGLFHNVEIAKARLIKYDEHFKEQEAQP